MVDKRDTHCIGFDTNYLLGFKKTLVTVEFEHSLANMNVQQLSRDQVYVCTPAFLLVSAYCLGCNGACT